MFRDRYLAICKKEDNISRRIKKEICLSEARVECSVEYRTSDKQRVFIEHFDRTLISSISRPVQKGLKLEPSIFHQTQGSDAEQLDRTSNRISDVVHNWFECLTGPTTSFLTVSFLTIEGAFGA